MALRFVDGFEAPIRGWEFRPELRGGVLTLDGRPVALISPPSITGGHVIDTGRMIANALNEVHGMPKTKG